jgi:diacylglycerol kinase (ATP)
VSGRSRERGAKTGKKGSTEEVKAAEAKTAKPIKGQQGVARSLNHAYRGLIYAVRTQRNMRIHVMVAAVVMVLSLLVGVSQLELAILVLVITAVFVTEMFNTALEFTVDLATREYRPLAKLAKDVSAGAVLVASVAAVAVGYLILSQDLGPFSLETLERARRWPGHVTLVVLVLVAIAVLLLKALTRAPNSFLGGMPSGHAAVAFAAWVAASFIAIGDGTGRYAGLVSLITLLMALLVCQSRIESGIHTFYQVAAGALLGTLLAVAVFQLL